MRLEDKNPSSSSSCEEGDDPLDVDISPEEESSSSCQIVLSSDDEEEDESSDCEEESDTPRGRKVKPQKSKAAAPQARTKKTKRYEEDSDFAPEPITSGRRKRRTAKRKEAKKRFDFVVSDNDDIIYSTDSSGSLPKASSPSLSEDSSSSFENSRRNPKRKKRKDIWKYRRRKKDINSSSEEEEQEDSKDSEEEEESEEESDDEEPQPSKKTVTTSTNKSSNKVNKKPNRMSYLEFYRSQKLMSSSSSEESELLLQLSYEDSEEEKDSQREEESEDDQPLIKSKNNPPKKNKRATPLVRRGKLPNTSSSVQKPREALAKNISARDSKTCDEETKKNNCKESGSSASNGKSNANSSALSNQQPQARLDEDVDQSTPVTSPPVKTAEQPGACPVGPPVLSPVTSPVKGTKDPVNDVSGPVINPDGPVRRLACPVKGTTSGAVREATGAVREGTGPVREATDPVFDATTIRPSVLEQRRPSTVVLELPVLEPALAGLANKPVCAKKSSAPPARDLPMEILGCPLVPAETTGQPLLFCARKSAPPPTPVSPVFARKSSATVTSSFSKLSPSVKNGNLVKEKDISQVGNGDDKVADGIEANGSDSGGSLDSDESGAFANAIPESTLLAVARKTTELFEDKEIVFELNMSEGAFKCLGSPELPSEEPPRESTPIKIEPTEGETELQKKQQSPPKNKSSRYYDPALSEFLEKKYSENKYPSKDDFKAMESECTLTANKILYWFTNRRRRDKEPIPSPSRGRKRNPPSTNHAETEEQRKALIDFFNQNPYPSKDDLAQLERDIGMPRKKVFYWFCNRRRKEKPEGFVKRKIKKTEEVYEPTTVEAGCIGLGAGWRCLQCDYGSNNRQNLFRHFRVSHSLSAKYCKKCAKIFKKDEYFTHPCLKNASNGDCKSPLKGEARVMDLSDIVVPKVFDSEGESCDEKTFKNSFLKHSLSDTSSSSDDDDAEPMYTRTPTKAELKSPNKFYSGRYKELLTRLGSKANKNADLHEVLERNRFHRNGKLELSMVTGDQFDAVLEFINSNRSEMVKVVSSVSHALDIPAAVLSIR